MAEDRTPRFQVAHKLPGVGCQIVAIIGCDAVLAECLFQPVDLLPGEPDARSDNQNTVGDRRAVAERDLIVFGLERRGGRFQPGRLFRHYARCGALGR